MLITGAGREFIIKDTHRGLWYEDGKLTKVLEAGRYKIPPQKPMVQAAADRRVPAGRRARARVDD